MPSHETIHGLPRADTAHGCFGLVSDPLSPTRVALRDRRGRDSTAAAAALSLMAPTTHHPLLTIHVYTPRPFHHSQRVPGDERHTHTHADKQPHPRPFTLVLVVSPPAHVMLATPPTPLANHPSSTCPRKPSRQLTAAAKWYHTRNTLPHPAPSAHQAHGRAGGRSWSTCIVDAHSPPPRPRPRPLPTTQSAFDHLDAKNNTRPLHWPRSHYPMRHPQSLPRRNQVGLEGDALAD